MNGTRKSVQIGVRQGATKTVDLDIPAGVDTGDVLETQVGREAVGLLRYRTAAAGVGEGGCCYQPNKPCPMQKNEEGSECCKDM